MNLIYQSAVFNAIRQAVAVASVDRESNAVVIRNADGAIACLMMAAMLLATSEFTSSPENIDGLCAASAKRLAGMIYARAFLASGEDQSARQAWSKVCRMHGAAGGAPKGNRNALKHGSFTAETLALKREIQALARLARETMAAIE